MPTVSVIIPVYNAEPFIEDCLQSVLAQSFQDYEVIVVDDGSPDQSIARIERFLSDARIRVVWQENRGLAGARNTGIRHAKGRYIALLDADDLWHPNKLACHVEHLNHNPNIGISFSRSEFIDVVGKPTGTYVMSKLNHISAEDLLFCNPIGNGSSPVIRREVLEEIGFIAESPHLDKQFFDERFRRAEDYECWVRIALKTAWHFAGLPEPLTLYRINTTSLSSALESQYQATEEVLSAISVYAPDFILLHGSLAKAYNAKYIARSALRQGQASDAVRYILKALMENGQILIKEPRSTVMIGIAALLMVLMPHRIFQRLEAVFKALYGGLQVQRIKQDRFVTMDP